MYFSNFFSFDIPASIPWNDSMKIYAVQANGEKRSEIQLNEFPQSYNIQMYDWGKFIDYSLYIDSFTLSFKITLLFFHLF